jgi:hypothetical protein
MKKYTLLAISALLVYSLQAQIWEDNLLKSNSSPTVTENLKRFKITRKRMHTQKEMDIIHMQEKCIL